MALTLVTPAPLFDLLTHLGQLSEDLGLAQLERLDLVLHDFPDFSVVHTDTYHLGKLRLEPLFGARLFLLRLCSGLRIRLVPAEVYPQRFGSATGQSIPSSCP